MTNEEELHLIFAQNPYTGKIYDIRSTSFEKEGLEEMKELINENKCVRFILHSESEKGNTEECGIRISGPPENLDKSIVWLKALLNKHNK
jgi:hypothetical protein